MPKLTRHFHSDEFRSRDGAEHPIDTQLLCMLECIRSHFKQPITITSGYRSPAHNAKVGGAKNSYHIRGMAADIKVKGVSPRQVFDFCISNFDYGGFGLYASWTHIDSRENKTTWSRG